MASVATLVFWIYFLSLQKLLAIKIALAQFLHIIATRTTGRTTIVRAVLINALLIPTKELRAVDVGTGEGGWRCATEMDFMFHKIHRLIAVKQLVHTYRSGIRANKTLFPDPFWTARFQPRKCFH